MPENLSPSAAGELAERQPTSAARPAYLLADSRLLFESSAAPSLTARLRAELAGPEQEQGRLSAAYLGASNGDQPAFYEIFEAAMEPLGILRRRFVRAAPAAGDLDFLRRADLLLLAGGDPALGWRALVASGAAAIVASRYRAGALLVGVSAGAVQLGHGWLPPGEEELVPTAGLLPFLIGAHEEPDWQNLRRSLRSAPEYLGGLGIPFGGAAIVAPDMTVEPFGKPLLEIFRRGEEQHEALLLPGEPFAGKSAAAPGTQPHEKDAEAAF